MRKQSALRLASASDIPAAAPQSNSHDVLVAAASNVVSAYIMNRPQEEFNLHALLADVYATLFSLSQNPLAAQPKHPSVSIEDSVKEDYLVCLEDGKRVKMLKRHLKAAYNMTPDEYRSRWNLPANYPMVAPSYAVVRSKLAKEIGLGRRGAPVVAKAIGEKRVAR